ncbi:hypothetical protein MNV49_007960 [Pseudohyphozyma bogoriensis]|nr:hypothetical protein MNV49_007960 [Pseudohyphozyma bogoriensis]
MALSPPPPPESVPLTPRTSSESSRGEPNSRPGTSRTVSSLSMLDPSGFSPPRGPPEAFSDRTPDKSTAEIVLDAGREGGSNSNSEEDEIERSVDANEGSPMLGRWTEGEGEGEEVYTPGSENESRDELLRLSDDEGLDDLEEGLGSASNEGLSGGMWESSWSEEGTSSWSGTHLTRGQKRRVYGGGKHGHVPEGGGLGAGEVAGLLLAGTLGPTPLLIPHAAALLGLPLFLPLLILTSVLSWFSYLVLGVEARYVGARSWPSLTSAVFPHRLKTHRLGELLASLLVLLSAIARGIVGVVGASEVVVDLLVPAGGRRWWERVVGIGSITVCWIAFPLIVLPLFFRTWNTSTSSRRRRGTAPKNSSLSKIPSYITFISWPIALLILGVRLKTLNALPLILKRDASVPITVAPTQREAMGYSIWGGISILVFSLSAHQDTFKYLTSLARPPSTATRGSIRSPALGIGRSATESSAGTDREGRRNQWPLASALGVGGSFLTQMGWGLVGYLGIDGGGREGNLFASDKLPRGDPWLFIVRLLVLLAIIVGLEGSLQTAYGRVRKGLVLLSGGESTTKAGKRVSRSGGGNYERVGGGSDGATGTDWKSAFSRIIVWVAVGIVSVLVTSNGEEGEGLVSVAEIAGCIGSSLLGFLVPSLFFIALFHLRRPRSIFISDPSAPVFASDTLLMRKEREVQRRLSGRRIWQDVLVFGGLLPFGTVAVVRGIIALAVKEE